MLTIDDIKRYQSKMDEVRKNGFKASEYKALGRELQQEFNLTVTQVLAVLDGR